MLLIFRSQNPPPLQQHYLVHEREIIIHTIWILLSFKTMLYIVVTKLYFSFDLEFINFPFHFDCHCICSIQKCTSVQKKKCIQTSVKNSSESCTNCTDKKAKWRSNAAHDADVVHFFFSDELYSIAGFPLRIQ